MFFLLSCTKNHKLIINKKILMSPCNFDIKIGNDYQGFFDKMKTLIENEGGIITGDKDSGNIQITKDIKVIFSFKATIIATYTRNEDTIHITVTKKPDVLGCSNIQKEVEKILLPIINP